MAWTITIPFICLLLLSAGSIGNLVLHHSVVATQDLARQLEQETGDRAAEQLQNWLSKPVMVNQLNLNALLQENVELDDPAWVGRRFLAQLQTFRELSELMIADSRGRSLTLTRLPDEQGYRLQQILRPYRLGQASEAIGQEILFDKNGEELGTRSIPVVDLCRTLWYQRALKKREKTWVKQLNIGRAIAAQPIFDSEGEIGRAHV